jgi:hypothetical protein
MITAHLKGGLGNQMFQIAAAYSLALDNKDKCAFFMGNPNINQGNPAQYYRSNVFRKLEELSEDLVTKPWYPEIRYMEPRINYDPVPYKDGMVLQGFFQSEKYFYNHKKEIVNLFQFTEEVSNFRNSVSIHVRRGDYLDPFMSNFVTAQPIEYYMNALALIESRKQIDNILIFSDDISWCIANFRDSRINFIRGATDYVELQTMSECYNNIISSSSFSWWGAYLNRNENKIVVAPARWFGPAVVEDWQDIYCEKWIKI